MSENVSAFNWSLYTKGSSFQNSDKEQMKKFFTEKKSLNRLLACSYLLEKG